MFAYCNLAIVPLRAEASDRSEMVTQVLFGEHFTILEQTEKWSKIQLSYDKYEGWMDNKQYQLITEDDFNYLEHTSTLFASDLVDFVSTENNQLMSIPLGSCLNGLKRDSINIDNFQYEGRSISGQFNKSLFLKTAFMYLNAPYLWGGKTPFGIDCSGFTQMVYRINGYNIPRDASQQATIGEALSFIEESEVGDLAFFDNSEGNIVHVGIIMENNYIIHAHGKVRIDRLDHLGIYNIDSGRHTHKLRVIKKIL
ncbi:MULTISPECIES: C40 family peptidase [Myroides]|uniref:SH3 domain-containing protein n=1 Tax=Myroides albus TaxID=2562892 RepID=A0A6I3LN22_9FLAO|nr:MULTISPECIES: C40 family peptidase [Myroides]MTG97981.1 SH3 domain-containing protein [Myroides albus]MVX36418.1 SH3 domain-containing protein [Myroides sp. LoEW2-1]UVD80272.1 C40 family peptidase [Myroides albus]